jgi:predicted dehydrogenase
MVFTMNAGFIPANSWVHDPAVGGGRLLGEACHFIDLASYIAQSHVVAVCANGLGPNVNERCDNAIITLRFASGAQAVVNYFSNGSKAYSKERAEVYHQDRTLILDNFRTLKGFGYKGADLKTQLDKGHKTQFGLLFERLRSGGPALIPFESIYNTTKASLAILESLKTGAWVEVA